MRDHGLFSRLDVAEEGTPELAGMYENPRKLKSTETEKGTEHPRTTGQPQKAKHTGEGSGRVCPESLQSCRTLCDARDYGLPGSSVHGVLQPRILEGLPWSHPSLQPPSLSGCCPIPSSLPDPSFWRALYIFICRSVQLLSLFHSSAWCPRSTSKFLTNTKNAQY